MRLARDFICTIQKFNFFAGIKFPEFRELLGTNLCVINQNLQNSRNLIPPKNWFPYRYFVRWAFHFPWFLRIIAFSFQKLLVNMYKHTNLTLLQLLCKWWKRKKTVYCFFHFWLPTDHLRLKFWRTFTRNYMIDLEHYNSYILLHLVCYMMIVAGAQTRIFLGRRGFLQSEHLNKHFIFDTRKKDRAVKNILHVLKLFLKNCSYKKNLNLD